MNSINPNQAQLNTTSTLPGIVRVSLAILFLFAIMIYVGGYVDERNTLLIVAAVIGGYMALNIGANDVANNVGPAVGSKAITLTGAIIIAAIFESSGALVAGGDVVGTIKKGIIDPALINDTDTFVWLMTAALLAAALWLNLSTYFGAPVSTTHSIVGGVLGAGIAAGGFGIANWAVFGKIAASWFISPIMGGIIAALFLYLIKRTITYKTDMLSAAKGVVPILIALMAWAFSTYLMMKGFKKIWQIDLVTAISIGFFIAVSLYLMVRPLINRATLMMQNTKFDVDTLFTIPLICAAALLSFAHGANDVANSVGPLAAINDAFNSGGITEKAAIPLWVMAIGAIGISIGLALYGPKLIHTVGSEITELDKTRAFCISMAAAITVIIASQLGLPISSTHTAVGAVFGVGFLREYLKNNYDRMIDKIIAHHEDDNPKKVAAFLKKFQKSSVTTKRKMLKLLKRKSSKNKLTKSDRKKLQKVYRQELVKRSQLYKIAAAWIITVPLSALLAALLFFTIRGFMLT
ncbi:MAG: inorganic phosphate transporter [Methylococcales bacterium]